MDCRDYIIIPGLFNSHFHGYYLTAKGLAKEMKIEKFILEFMKDDFSTMVHNLLMETRENSIHHVMVDGKWVLYNQELKMIDEMELNRQYLDILNKLQK